MKKVARKKKTVKARKQKENGVRIIRSGKTHILVLDRDDPEKELDFEIGFQLSLSTRQRFRMMFEYSKKLAERLIRDGHRKPIAIIKRS